MGEGCVAGEQALLFTIDKLMSGSSLEDKEATKL